MDSDYLPIVLIIIVLAIIGGALIYFSTSTSEFNEGDLYFQIPGSWNQHPVVGNFNDTVYSEVTYSKEITDTSGQKYESYINVQRRLISGTSFNITSLQVSVLNSSNSTVSNLKINEYNILILNRNSPNVSNKLAVVDDGTYEYIIEYICPPAVKNETEEAYSEVLNTLRLNK